MPPRLKTQRQISHRLRPEGYLTAIEFANIYGVKYGRVMYWALQRNKLKYKRIGTHTYIAVEELYNHHPYLFNTRSTNELPKL